MIRATIFVNILLVALLSPFELMAQMTEVPWHDAEQGRLLFKSEQQQGHYLLAPTLKTDVNMTITELALKYHLVTQYTSLLAVDVTPSKHQGETAVDQGVTNHLPDGWTSHQVDGLLPQGATSAQLNLLLGLLLALLSWIWHKSWWQRLAL